MPLDFKLLKDACNKLNLQVLSLLSAPFLLEHPKVGEMFPSDAIARAKQLLTYAPGGKQLIFCCFTLSNIGLLAFLASSVQEVQQMPISCGLGASTSCKRFCG